MAEVTHIPSNSTAVEMLHLGHIKIRILSSGGAQKSCLIMHLPRRTPGLPLHSHRMHATTFLVLKGRIRWNSPDNTFDARAGSFIEVPAASKYGFSNPFNEVAEIFLVYFPGFYVECMRELAALWKDNEDAVVSVEQQVQIMKGWGTVLVSEEESLAGDDEEMEEDDDGSEEEVDERGAGLQCMA
jgi:mannose-6-phosphate isomerase-like protein (cupin superfamily)